MNYITKFAIGDTVQITEGLYRGKIGTVVDYQAFISRGFVEMCDREDTIHGQYIVKIGWFKTITVLPRSLCKGFK